MLNAQVNNRGTRPAARRQVLDNFSALVAGSIPAGRADRTMPVS
jgi:hypothetical protein